MTALRLKRIPQRQLAIGLIAAAVLALAYLLGRRASPLWLALLTAGIGGMALLARPPMRPIALILAALVIPVAIGTGTEVRLGAAALLVPALAVLWLQDLLLKRQTIWPASRTYRPLLLFLFAGIISLLIGNATWDPSVPRPANFTLVQLAQWAIFAFSGIAFWLMASWTRSETRLRGVTLTYLLVGGITTILWVSPARPIISPILAVTPGYPLLLLLLGTLSAAELFYDRTLSRTWRWFLAAVLVTVIYQTLMGQRENISTLVAVLAGGGVLVWLRFPHLRRVIALTAFLLALSGVLFPAAFEFAGGESEWQASGGSRLVLASRVIEETLRNPITGLGPASYRVYSRTTPLPYLNAYWMEPQVSSHNNYVDLFSHVGILGLGFFLWFVVEVMCLGLQLRKHTAGFAAGYVDAILATWVGMMLMMALGDWLLPFVYNLGFPAFQGSVLVWMFMGGLVVLENMEISKVGSPG